MQAHMIGSVVGYDPLKPRPSLRSSVPADQAPTECAILRLNCRDDVGRDRRCFAYRRGRCSLSGVEMLRLKNEVSIILVSSTFPRFGIDPEDTPTIAKNRYCAEKGLNPFLAFGSETF
jgi:hypothetical protein